MVYTKNHNPWAAGDVVTVAILNNFETIYTESASYLSSHNHDALYQTKTEMEAAYWYAGNDGSGSGSDADFLYKSTGNLHAASFTGLGVVTGLVVLWYGSTGSIPSGWHLCDGTVGTVDLRNRFIVGAGTGSSYSVGDTGGSTTFTAAGSVAIATHALTTAEIPAHHHPFTDTSPTSFSQAEYQAGSQRCGGPDSTSSGSTASAGSGDAHGHSAGEGTSFTGNAVNSMPFYYALCYIQKLAP